MPGRESCGSVPRCGLPPFDPLRGSRACRHACRLELPSRLPSREAGTCNLHSDCCQTVPNFPRLRALALFGRRPLQRGVSLVIPATKNLHRNRHGVYNLFFAGGLRPRGCSSALSGARHLFGLDQYGTDVLKGRGDARRNEGDKPTDTPAAS
jgi:hypothetical protein